MKLAMRIIIVVLPVVLAAVGYLAGSVLARHNHVVNLADQVLGKRFPADQEPSDAQRVFEAYQKRLERERRRSGDEGLPVGEQAARDSLRAEAEAAFAGFRLGGAVFGAWCGIVAALRIAALRRVPRRTEYEIDQGACMACGRCFNYCPRERLRLKKLVAGTDGP